MGVSSLSIEEPEEPAMACAEAILARSQQNQEELDSIWARGLAETEAQRRQNALTFAEGRAAFVRSLAMSRIEGARAHRASVDQRKQASREYFNRRSAEESKLDQLEWKNARDHSQHIAEMNKRADQQDLADHKGKVEALKKGAPAPIDEQAWRAQMARQLEETKREADEAERIRDQRLKELKAKKEAQRLAKMRAKKQGTKGSSVG